MFSSLSPSSSSAVAAVQFVAPLLPPPPQLSDGLVQQLRRLPVNDSLLTMFGDSAQDTTKSDDTPIGSAQQVQQSLRVLTGVPCEKEVTNKQYKKLVEDLRQQTPTKAIVTDRRASEEDLR